MSANQHPQWQAIAPVTVDHTVFYAMRDTEGEAIEDAHNAAQKHGTVHVYRHGPGPVEQREVKQMFTITREGTGR